MTRIREDRWADGFYQDNMVKYEYLDYKRTFIVCEDMKKESPPGFPICPYCGQSKVEVRKSSRNDDLGCMGLFIDTGED